MTIQMCRKNIFIQNAFSFGINFIKNNIKTSTIIVIILIGFNLLNLIVYYKMLHPVFYNIMRVIIIIGIYLYVIALIQIARCWYDYRYLSKENLRLSQTIVIRHFGGTIIFILFFFLTTLLLIIPGIYYFLTYYFFQYFIIDKNSGIKEAFKSSYKITKGQKLKLLIFYLLATTPSFILYFLIVKGLVSHNLILIILLFIPSAIWSILVGLATFHIYRQLLGFLKREDISM